MASEDEADLFAFLSDELPDKRGKGMARPTLMAGLALLAMLVAAAIVVPMLLVEERREALESELDRRLRILAQGQAQLLGTWLEGTTLVAGRITDSELFRLFATEMALAGGDLSEVAGGEASSGADLPMAGDDPLLMQLPYMEQLLDDFAQETSVLGAILIGPGGNAYARGGAVGDLGDTQKREAIEVFDRGTIHYGPVRAAAAGLLMDLYVPIFPIQVEAGEGRPAAVLLLTAPVAGRFAEALAPRALSEPGERLRLIQEGAAGFAEIVPGASPPFSPTETAGLFDSDGAISFAAREALGGGVRVYSAGAAVSGTALWVVQEIDAAEAEAGLDGFARAAASVAILLGRSVGAAYGACWWTMADSHSRALANQYRDLAGRIEGQRRLLDSINRTIADHIGLKELDGTYRYVNAAFADAAGRPAEQLEGLDDAAIFGGGTAKRLEVSDRQALDLGHPVTVDHEVFLGDRRRNLQISKVPFPDESGEVTGIVSVARDVTELVEAQRKKERAVQQMVAALVRAIELRDPYLAGHSKRVAEFAAETARRLGAEADEIATVEIAANLSQIGKLAIPRELLTKTERLSAAEIVRMQTHVSHAAKVLEGVDFELPVLETIAQMHERLDGRGYPKGLAGDEIRLSARVLAACDVFCARVEPRSYRAGIAPQAALEVLGQHPDRYDPEVVAALGAVAASVAGEKLIAGIDAA
ncbi:MAG: HD domain-containing phosphohydrolase [Kiloniellales bacterium]